MDEIFLLTFYHDFYGERETENYVHKSESGAQKTFARIKRLFHKSFGNNK